MTLSAYHQKYANQSEEEMQKRIHEKELELQKIFDNVQLKTKNSTIKIAVLGCGDKRYIKAHKVLFTKILNKPVDVTTFDITIEHLQGEENIIKHDCTLPLPNPPYDITFAHVLLRFIETEKQWDLLMNSYEALENGGIAIHVLDKEDYEPTEEKLNGGYYAVPLKRWEEKLKDKKISFKEIEVNYGKVLVIQK